MEKIYQELSGQGITQLAGIGIYYNDPATITSGQELRSDVGSVVDEKDVGKLQRNSSVYKVKTIPQAVRVVAEFPYKNSFSYMVGPIKMYPLVNKYMAARAYKLEIPRIELYDMDMKKIYFIADVVK